MKEMADTLVNGRLGGQVNGIQLVDLDSNHRNSLKMWGVDKILSEQALFDVSMAMSQAYKDSPDLIWGDGKALPE